MFFFLPGVPIEMRRFMADDILPRIERLQGKGKDITLTKTLNIFGITEAETGERVAHLPDKFPSLKVGIRAKFPVIQVKLYARGTDENTLRQQVEDASDWVVKDFGYNVFSKDGNTMEAEIGKLLLRKNATISIAESCTGGLISDWLTNVSGSSKYFLFSGVTYSNNAKISVLGVSKETIEKYGAVHEKTAQEMAEGARRIVGATYGLATSGIAGPDGGTPEKPVGTVCIGIATPERAEGKRYHFYFPERLRNKTIFAMAALECLRRELL
jgi:nicotinamide-nucleotide amidase